jgi:septal ring factor EnvC (AmiA/AmiB activator)
MEKRTMQTSKKLILIPFEIMLLLLVPNCSGLLEQPSTAPPSDGEQAAGNEAVAERFQESTLQGPTAVESAIELSEKYAKLSEEAAVIRQQNNDLITENRRLEEQVASLEADLLQAQKELTEANSLLREMIVELNNWKADVIGFREEMRSAEKAQLQALLKILQILGGEVDLELGQDEQQGQSSTSAGAPDQSQ